MRMDFPRRCMCGVRLVMYMSFVNVWHSVTSWFGSPAGIRNMWLDRSIRRATCLRRGLREYQPNAGYVVSGLPVDRE